MSIKILNKEKLLVLCYDWPNNKGGYNKSILSCIEQYALIYDVTTVIFSEDNFYSKKYNNLDLSFKPVHILIDAKKYIRSFLYSIITRRPAVEYRYYQSKNAFIQKINFQYFDYIITQGVLLGRMIEGINLSHIKAKVLMSHDCFHNAYNKIWKTKNNFQKLPWYFEEKLLKMHEKKSFRLHNKKYAITKHDFNMYNSHGINCDGVFHRFPNFNITNNKIENKRIKKFVTIGRVDDRKSSGLSQFITHVFKKLKLTDNEYEYHIIGKGSKNFDEPNAGVYGYGFVENLDLFTNNNYIFVNPQFQVSGLQFKLLYALQNKMVILSNINSAKGFNQNIQDYMLLYQGYNHALNLIKNYNSNNEFRQKYINKMITICKSDVFTKNMYSNNYKILTNFK
jgi:hypothetical protein